MKCPKCGTWTKVLDSRRLDDRETQNTFWKNLGKVRRRRRCPRCGLRLTTSETIKAVDDPNM